MPSLAYGIGIYLQIGNGSAQCIAMHSELVRRLALISFFLLQDHQHECLLELTEGVIESYASAVHLFHNTLKLSLHHLLLTMLEVRGRYRQTALTSWKGHNGRKAVILVTL